MRLRLALLRPLLFAVVLFVLALVTNASASAYPWPIKPFYQQHPIRANFGDPRTRFWNPMLTDGLQGPGEFLFHNGIDISAPEGTPVYPVISGTASLIDPAAVLVRSPGHKFQYFHIHPAVHNGQHVIAQRTVLGTVIHAANHVHLSELRGRRIWNPLARGGIAPYVDHTTPQVDSIFVRPERSLVPLNATTLCGTVSLVAAAHDEPPLPVPGTFAGFPVSPAYVTWTLTMVGGAVYVPTVAAADFRTTLPLPRDFWNVYARGTFQNAPRLSNRQFSIPGNFLYNLSPTFDTHSYPNGLYDVSVHVSDMRGNSSDSAQQFRIDNVPGEPCLLQ